MLLSGEMMLNVPGTTAAVAPAPERFCTKCGGSLVGGAQFCSKCGTPAVGVMMPAGTMMMPMGATAMPMGAVVGAVPFAPVVGMVPLAALPPEHAALARATFLTGTGGRVGGATSVFDSFAIDEDLWRAANAHKKSLHACSGKLPKFAAMMACTPPWVAHVVLFSPCLWCIPMLCNVVCCHYVDEDFEHKNRALVLTNAGVAGFGPGPTFREEFLAWDGFSIDAVGVNKYDQQGYHAPIPKLVFDDPYSIAFGAGCLLPCCAIPCCQPKVPGLYHAQITSIHQTRYGKHRKPTAIIDLVGLKASPEAVLSALKAGAAAASGGQPMPPMAR